MSDPILVVDDEESVGVTLQAILERDGFAAEWAGSVEEALTRLRGGRYAGVVLDLNLGDGSGLNLLARVRQTAPEAVTIVLTGYGTLASAVEAMRLGVTDYLIKPCPIDDLKAALDRGLARRQALLDSVRRSEKAAERAQRLQAVTAALSAATTVADVGRAIAEQAVAATGADAGALGVITEDGVALAIAGAAGYGEQALAPFARFPLSAPLPMSDVVRTGQAAWFPDHTAFVTRYPHVATEPGRARLAVIPLVVGAGVLGSIALSFPDARPFDAEEREFILAVSHECARALERARLYDQMQAAVRLRDDFLSVAAHELKTPLAGLHGNAQLLARVLDRNGTIDPERLRRMVGIIDQQAVKLAHLIGQLLDVSRLDAANLVLERAPIDLTAIVADVVAAARERSPDHPIEVVTRAPVVASVDALRLEQVVTNLLDNAIKFSARGAPIVVEVAAFEPGAATLTVTDRGIGIPPERRAQLFDRFYQAHAADYLSGLGLGLYLSRQIVELHGGTLDAEFPESGGTRFVVRLPTGLA